MVTGVFRNLDSGWVDALIQTTGSRPRQRQTQRGVALSIVHLLHKSNMDRIATRQARIGAEGQRRKHADSFFNAFLAAFVLASPKQLWLYPHLNKA
jgi:hypothetical protein